ncbi:hypothetical protein N431DRAFT_388781 [Stipitochalara longipes BDJ]|nr:hypothetical protein N431DRAFT_388781 [Stipitochalara longipes BDJ]
MVTITVGYIAGIIAAAIFVSRIWAPMVITFILSGVLKDKNSAATWTVASRAFERTHWPDVLRSDSVKNNGVRKSVIFLTNFVSLMALLIAIAGIVTPLGIYQTLAPTDNVQTPFKYLLDTSPFGIGTPVRSDLSYNRICTTDDLASGRPIPCPFSDTVEITTFNETGYTISLPYGYDISIPQIILDTYSSGVGNDTTISNFFDIQWRQYMITADPSKIFNNGSSYLVEAFRGMQTLGLDNSVEAIEGLVVDTVSGGIGFRNHTVPPGFQFGVTWDEDLLFIEPETVCVDTNTTIDYAIGGVINLNSTFPIVNLTLTDRGGFVNINHTYPEANLSNPQKNPDLWTRAYKAAWMTNVYSMLWYNVTNPNNFTSGRKSFSYMNSFMNKTFPLVNLGDAEQGFYDSLSMDGTFNMHLNLDSDGPGNSSDPAAGGLPNPFDINSNNFTDIGLLCAGAGDGDYANITNILVRCGLMSGVPQRQDQGSNLIFQPGSRWSQPLYTCASAVKTSIKTVSFVFNGTYELQNLKISSIQSKEYPDASSLPLWGVENTGNAYTASGLSMIWGLVSEKYENNPNVSTVRQENLYLPGFFSTLASLEPISPVGSQNLPASDFYHEAMDSAYLVGLDSTASYDYSGGNNMAIWSKWQNLSNNTASAALIPNLIFTDYAAAAVVGTKGVLGPGNAATQNLVPLPVTPTVSVIRYHWPFAIPALMVAFGLLFFTTLATFTMLCRRHNISRLRAHLNQLSPGRIFTNFLSAEPGINNLSAKDWNRRFGKQMVDLSDEHHSDAGDGIVPEKPSAVIDSQAVFNDRNGEGQGFLGGHTGEADTERQDSAE